VRQKQLRKGLLQLFLPVFIDDYKRSDTSLYSTKSWSRMGSLRQLRWFTLKYFFSLYFKYFINLQTLESGVALPRCPPWLCAYCDNRILIAGYRPAQEFVIERSLAIFVKPQQWPTPSESIAIYCVRKLVSCVTHLQSCAKVNIWNKKKLRTVAKIKTQDYKNWAQLQLLH